MTKEKKSLLVLVTIGALLIASPLFVGTSAFSQNIDHWFRILEKHHFAPVAQTGQTIPYAPGDDGALQKGIPWPTPRFTDDGDGTVTDNLTGLIWMQNANCFDALTWTDALQACNTLVSGACGLADSSQGGDWRLPNVKELESLIDYGCINPTLPIGHPFTNLQSLLYWSSTSTTNGSGAWYVYFGVVYVNDWPKWFSHHNGLGVDFNAWCVRSGQ